MQDQFNIADYELLTRYLAGVLDKTDSDAIEMRLSSDSEFSRLFRHIKLIYSLKTENRDIDVDKAFQKTKMLIKASEKTSHKLSYKFVIYAAAAITLMLVSYAVFQFLIKTPDTALSTIGFATSDSIATHKLNDGSTVTLNKNSSIACNKEFNTEIREIYLKGEAFFEVSKNTEKPFVVNTGFAEIIVTGTRFFVSTQSETEVVVWVEEGSVIIRGAGQKGYVQLKSNDKGIYDKKTGIINRIPGDGDEMFWNNRKLSFVDISLQEACKTIENAYSCKIQIMDSSVSTQRITSSFTNENEDHVLEVIALTLGLRVEKNNNEYRLYGE